MARINTNVSSVIAQQNLARANTDLGLRLERLSTGLRINRGKDDPAGMIISQRISTDLAGVEQGIKNGDRASSVIATTEAALDEVSNLLNSIKALMVESANTGANSAQEREANQLQIDSAIDSITRISNTATFGGLKLLDGSLDYVTSGIDKTEITKAQINGASLVGRSSLQVEVDVVASAQQGRLYINGDNPGAATDGVLLSATTLQIRGTRGVQELTFSSGTPLSAVVHSVNQITAHTGIKAALVNPADHLSGMYFYSDGYGANEFVSVERVGGPGPAADSVSLLRHPAGAPYPGLGAAPDWASLVTANRDDGQDVQALINGTLATGRGLGVSINTPSLALELILDESFARSPAGPTSTFDITGGGSLFQLGPDIIPQQQANIGVQSVAASRLGGTLINGSLQFLSSLKKGQGNSIEENVQAGDFTNAQDILDTAIDEIAVLRGRLGAFERNVLETNKRSLQAAFENLTASKSAIVDADFASETSALTRAQILNSSSTSILALANQQAQSVLQLLG